MHTSSPCICICPYVYQNQSYLASSIVANTWSGTQYCFNGIMYHGCANAFSNTHQHQWQGPIRRHEGPCLFGNLLRQWLSSIGLGHTYAVLLSSARLASPRSLTTKPHHEIEFFAIGGGKRDQGWRSLRLKPFLTRPGVLDKKIIPSQIR